MEDLTNKVLLATCLRVAFVPRNMKEGDIMRILKISQVKTVLVQKHTLRNIGESSMLLVVA